MVLLYVSQSFCSTPVGVIVETVVNRHLILLAFFMQVHDGMVHNC